MASKQAFEKSLNKNEGEWVSVEAEVWKPEQEGDSIQGVLINTEENAGKYDGNAYYIENSDGTHLVFGTSVLDNRMKLVSIGDEVKIEYKGLDETKNGDEVKMFVVQKRRAEKPSSSTFKKSGVKSTESGE